MSDRHTSSDHRAFALHIAHRDDPRALVWIGAIVIVFAVVNTLTPPATPWWVFAGVLLLGAAMVCAGLLLRRPSTPDGLVPWAFAVAVTVFVMWLLVIYVDDPIEANLTYVLVATTAYGPLTFAWRPFATAGIAMLVAVAAAMAIAAQPRGVDWLIGIAASIAVSGVLLHLRLLLLGELDDAHAAVADLSTTDDMTGLLNRRGLEDRVVTLWADARRRNEPIGVYFLDVRGLKAANDEHGHQFGDRIIVDAADAISATARGGDLVARWGGDEFVVLGLGAGEHADGLATRIREHLASTGRASDHDWSHDVTVGHAFGSADAYSFGELLGLADGHMYRQRRIDGPAFAPGDA